MNWLLHMDERRRDDLAPTRGIAASVLIGLAIWLIIVATVHYAYQANYWHDSIAGEDTAPDPRPHEARPLRRIVLFS